MKEETIAVQTLICEGCVRSVAQVLGAFPEISDVRVDLEESTVHIDTEADDQRTKYEDTLARAGYPPVGRDNTFSTKAKSYVSCAIGKVSK